MVLYMNIRNKLSTRRHRDPSPQGRGRGRGLRGDILFSMSMHKTIPGEVEYPSSPENISDDND
jgi:hypothetical protein